MSNEQRLMDDIAAASIRVSVYEHVAVFTVEESIGLHQSIPGQHTKNLFLKSADDRYWLITIPHDRRADLKLIARKLDAGKLSFAKPEAMEQLLGIRPGAVSPLAAINDRELRVQVVVDASFRTDTTINVHPLRNTATVSMSTADLLGLLERWGHSPIVADLQAPVV
jgi:Ala-tRNA(Pro) deacylase